MWVQEKQPACLVSETIFLTCSCCKTNTISKSCTSTIKFVTFLLRTIYEKPKNINMNLFDLCWLINKNTIIRWLQITIKVQMIIVCFNLAIHFILFFWSLSRGPNEDRIIFFHFETITISKCLKQKKLRLRYYYFFSILIGFKMSHKY